MNVSQSLLDALGGGVGSPSLQCICGKHHHAVESDCLEDDEDVTMREDAARNPTRVMLHYGTDSVTGKLINGTLVVMECDCKWLENLELLIWNEKDRILDYYRRRLAAAKKASEALEAQLSEMKL